MARLHHVKSIRPVWAMDGDQKYKLTVETGQRSVSTVLDIESMREGFRGNEEVQARLVRELGGLIRSLVATASV